MGSTRPPPFFVGDLPKASRDNIVQRGFHGETYDELTKAGVTLLKWRQRPRHLENELVSDDVFQALVGIAPGSFRSKARFTIEGAGTYHQLKRQAFPKYDNDPAEISTRPTVVNSRCQPKIEDGIPLRKATADGLIVAFPLWAARDDKLLGLTTVRVVTEGFVTAWRKTDISQYLQRTNQELDIEFTPTKAVQTRKDVKYRWVDDPESM